jgi:hypothetical protein
MRLGKLIVFEGPDHCGKSAQANELCKRLTKNNLNFAFVKYPRYEDSIYGAMIRHMLYDNNINLLNDEKCMDQFSYLQLMDKLNSVDYIYKLLNEHDFVILDRYTLSGRIYDSSIRYLLRCKADFDFTPENKDKIKEYMEYYLREWAFSNVFRGPYYNHLFEDGLSILENNLYDIYHILFRSSTYIETIVGYDNKTNRDKERDNYENNYILPTVIKYVYDNIEEAIGFKGHPFFLENKFIFVNTDEITASVMPIYPDAKYSINVVSDYIYNGLWDLVRKNYGNK